MIAELPCVSDTLALASATSSSVRSINFPDLVPSRSETVRNEAQVSQVARSKYFVQVDNFIWLELSLIAEIEHVFVTKKENIFKVLTIVDEHSAALRKKIYAREAAIIDEYQL